MQDKQGLFDKELRDTTLNAIYQEDAEALKEILKRNDIDATKRNEKDLSPILMAAQQGKWELVLILANYFVAHGLQNLDDTLQYDQVSKLILFNAPDEIRKAWNKLDYEQFSERYSVESISALFEFAPSFRGRIRGNGDINPIIVHCAVTDRWEVVDVFAKHKVSPDQSEKLGYGEALLYAIEENQGDTANKLLDAGALPLQNDKTNHLVRVSFAMDRADVLQRILKAEINNTKIIDATQPYNNKSLILLAAENRSWGAVRVLAKHFEENKIGNESNHLQYTEVIKLAKKAGKTDIVDELKRLNEPYQDEAIKSVDVDTFKAIYNALYAAESSVFKTTKRWDKPFDLYDIEDHIKKHPNSRTAEALKLAKSFAKEHQTEELIKNIHEYGYQHSTRLFRSTINKTDLYSNTQSTINNAEPTSRTGKIRDILKGLKNDTVGQGSEMNNETSTENDIKNLMTGK